MDLAARPLVLHLLRHAKSDWSQPGVNDRDRPLNARGRRVRRLLAEHVRDWTVELVACSTAKRARATAKPIVAALGCPVQYEEALYDSGVGGALSVIRAFPVEVREVLIVGHNPTMEELTELLCGVAPRFPTAALATIELEVQNWESVERGTGSLRAFVTPADLGR